MNLFHGDFIIFWTTSQTLKFIINCTTGSLCLFYCYVAGRLPHSQRSKNIFYITFDVIIIINIYLILVYIVLNFWDMFFIKPYFFMMMLLHLIWIPPAPAHIQNYKTSIKRGRPTRLVIYIPQALTTFMCRTIKKESYFTWVLFTQYY